MKEKDKCGFYVLLTTNANGAGTQLLNAFGCLCPTAYRQPGSFKAKRARVKEETRTHKNDKK